MWRKFFSLRLRALAMFGLLACVLSCLLLAGFSINRALAEGADKVFMHLSTLQKSGVRPFVIDGDSPTNPDDWQASLFTNDGGIFCTATVIGAHVVLTAAHCLDKGPTIGFTIKSVDYTASCTIAAKYTNNTDKSADYALCLTKVAISGIRFERLSFDPAELARATTLTLAGFGCTRIVSPIIKGFQIGKAKLLKRPGEIADAPNLLQVLGGAALCPGDSGGGAFIIPQPSHLRKLVGINSELNKMGNDGTISTLASVSTPDFLCFGKQWLGDNAGNVAIAGFPTTVSCQP